MMRNPWLQAGALCEDLGVPVLSESEGESLVLTIDPLSFVTANLYSALLRTEPGVAVPADLRDLSPGDLAQRGDVVGEMIDLYREAARGLRGAKDGRLLVAATGQQAVTRLVDEVAWLLTGPADVATEQLRSDAGELFQMVEQEQAERTEKAGETKRMRTDADLQVAAVDRQNRFLKTVLSMRNREAVSGEELEEAIATYEDITGEEMAAHDPRKRTR